MSTLSPLDNSRGYYHQFPLCILAMSADHSETLANIAAYSCGKLADEIAGRLSDVVNMEGELIEAYAETFGELPYGYDPELASNTDVAIVAAASALGYEIPDLFELLDRLASVREFVMGFEKRHGKDALVRLHPERFNDAGGEEPKLSPPEFRALCAILSFLRFGEEKLTWITPSLIAPRMLGYRSAKIMLADLQGVRPRLMQRPHLAVLTARLAEKGAIRGRCTIGTGKGSRTYYSAKLTTEELRQRIAAGFKATPPNIVPLPAMRKAA